MLLEQHVKLCRSCGERKPLDQMKPDKSVKSGRSNFCRRCATEKSKQRLAKKRREAGCRIYEIYDEATRIQRHNDAASRYAKKNREKCVSAVKASRVANPDLYRALKANRRALEKNTEGVFSKLDIEYIKGCQKNKCAACKSLLNNKYHVDHIIALSKGGTNWPRNLQILCPTCNVRKHALANEDFMRRNFGALL